MPVRGDGTIDEDEVQCLEGIAQWMAINGEAIFGTRPWKTYGEGYREAKAGNFNEGKGRPYTAADLRFTTKGNTLYVFFLAWPADGKMVVKSLGSDQAGIRGDVTGRRAAGAAGKVAVQARARRAGRHPAGRSGPANTAWALKIKGLDLAASQPGDFVVVVPYYVRPDKNGNLHFHADDADLTASSSMSKGTAARRCWPGGTTPRTGPPGTSTCPAGRQVRGHARAASPRAARCSSKSRSPARRWSARSRKRRPGRTMPAVKLGRIEIPSAGKYTLKVRPHEAADGRPSTWRKSG